MREMRMMMLPMLLFMGLTFSDYSSADTIRVLLGQAHMHRVLQVNAAGSEGMKTEINTADCPPFDSERFSNAYRFEVELAILCNVLFEQGLADKIEFIAYPTVKRAVINLENNLADIIGETKFQADVTPGVIATDAVLELGDFKVGVFTAPNRKDVLAITSQDELRKLRGLTVTHWPIDVKTLHGMGLQSVIATSLEKSISPMIANDRADIFLSYLDRATTSHLGGQLVRIDGFRVTFDDTRVFLVSPKRKDIADAINKFIQKNRASDVDRIREIFKTIGFIVDKYDDWVDVTKP